MQWSLDWTVGSILAASAIISPILTAIINNHHLMKIRKLDQKKEAHQETAVYKRKLIESYLQKTASCVHYHTPEHREQYSESFGRLVSYVSDEIQKQMILIDDCIDENDDETARHAFIRLIPQLTDIVQKL